MFLKCFVLVLYPDAQMQQIGWRALLLLLVKQNSSSTSLTLLYTVACTLIRRMIKLWTAKNIYIMNELLNTMRDYL